MNNVYKVAVLKLNEHFTPHTNVMYERSVFRSMCQLLGESIDKYITLDSNRKHSIVILWMKVK